ncbi:hypothetical protein B0H10DRAFT_1693341, partial [Mycena sp. CBHHK59/15]
KDVFNEMGASRFATDNNQQLTHFYSIDTINYASGNTKDKWQGSQHSGIRTMTDKLHSILWDASPSTSGHIPGKLSLCRGMPVMIRSNVATELCITKGQEATVVSWDSTMGINGNPVLDTLFVKLINPPKEVNLPDLPINVVPLTRTKNQVTCLLPDDSLLSVVRDQVNVLLNFAMTDYGSQGKSKAYNVVDLANCKNHMSYYVALSRGTSAEGTLIVQGFDEKKITSGMSGYLRQELREIEILDEITTLRFEGILPVHVTGLYRRHLLHSFQAWKGKQYEPAGLHKSIYWSSEMGPKIQEQTIYGKWTITARTVKETLALSKKTKTQPTSKRKSDHEDSEQSFKKHKLTDTEQRACGDTDFQNNMHIPVGLPWNSTDFSCSYDSVFTILFSIWRDNPELRTEQFECFSSECYALAVGFHRVMGGLCSLTSVRDTVRNMLHNRSPCNFPYGHNNASVDQLVDRLAFETGFGNAIVQCPQCNYQLPGVIQTMSGHCSVGISRSLDIQPDAEVSLVTWFENHFNKPVQSCPSCLSQRATVCRMVRTTTLQTIPPLLFLTLESTRIVLTKHISLKVQNEIGILKLRGIVYFGNAHFTSRIISRDGTIWFHDG